MRSSVALPRMSSSMASLMNGYASRAPYASPKCATAARSSVAARSSRRAASAQAPRLRLHAKQRDPRRDALGAACEAHGRRRVERAEQRRLRPEQLSDGRTGFALHVRRIGLAGAEEPLTEAPRERRHLLDET